MRKDREDIYSIKMKLKDQVVSLELARELKELGVGQDSIWIWLKNPCSDSGYECALSWDSDPSLENYSAPTVAELGEMLKGEIVEGDETITKANSYYLDCGKIEHESSYYVRYIRHDTSDTFCITHGNTEADARAKMWIFLRKNAEIK